MDAARARGERVRMVDRIGRAPVPDDVEVVARDASDPGVDQRGRRRRAGRLPGAHPGAAGRAWHLPDDPTTRIIRELVDVVHRLAGRSRTRLRTVHPSCCGRRPSPTRLWTRG